MNTLEAIHACRAVKHFDPEHRLTEASPLVILCADRDAWKKDPNRYWREAPEGVRDWLGYDEVVIENRFG
jgi:hypothetical protein